MFDLQTDLRSALTGGSGGDIRAGDESGEDEDREGGTLPFFFFVSGI